MLIILEEGCTPDRVEGVLVAARELGLEAGRVDVDAGAAILLRGYHRLPDEGLFLALDGVTAVVPVSHPARRVIEPEAAPRVLRVGRTTVGGGSLTLIAGPCAVESEEQLIPLARSLADAGAHLLRGGAFKPRSSPYDFQGLGERGLKLLATAREETGLPLITEALDEASLERVVEIADVVQIGSRNMHNYALLKRAGRCGKPVFLKRGMAATLEELLLAAEYVLDQGNPDVMLCERGIRTFSDHSRFTLDLSVIPRLRRYTALPLFVDPSHASGAAESVGPLSRAGIAAGADGVMVEVHPDPLHALCDGRQSLTPTAFATLASELRALASLLTGSPETVP